MVDIAIICPVEVEFEEIRRLLDCPEAMRRGNVSFEFGRVAGKDFDWQVAIVEPDLQVNSFSLKCRDVIDALRPKYLFLAGMAGGLKDAQPGDVVIGTKAYFYEGGKVTADGLLARPRVRNNPSIDLLQCARRMTRGWTLDASQFYFGPIVSGNKVLAKKDSETVRHLKQHYSDALAVEMESFEFSEAAIRANIPYLNIRGISDLIDGKAEADEAGSQQMASARVASFLRELLRKLPVPPQQEHYATKVSVATKQYAFYQWRNPQRMTIHFKDDYVELSGREDTQRLRQFKVEGPVRMPGDIGRSWVKIELGEAGAAKTLFLSAARPLGLGCLIGGSRVLLKHFQRFVKPVMDQRSFISASSNS